MFVVATLIWLAAAQHDVYLMLFSSPGNFSANIVTSKPASKARIAVDNPTTPIRRDEQKILVADKDSLPAPTTNTGRLYPITSLLGQRGEDKL